MIIDSHNHPGWFGFTRDSFVSNMRKNNIDVTWILSWEAPEKECEPQCYKVMPSLVDGIGPIAFQHCISYKEKYPEKFVLGYAPDPRKPDSIEKLNQAADQYNVQVYGELKLKMRYDDSRAVKMFRHCGEKNLPVVFHLQKCSDGPENSECDNLWYGGNIDVLDNMLKLCPHTLFIGHSAEVWAHFIIFGKNGKAAPGRLVEMLEKYDNLYCDISAGAALSALRKDEALTAKILKKHRSRILYGRDSFTNEHQEFINSLVLPQEINDMLYFKNALRLLDNKVHY